MTNSEQNRDRAYVRHVHIKHEDRDRFYEYLSTINRPKFITRVRTQGTIHIFHLKIKRQEELYIELAFDVTITKPRARRIKNSFGVECWKSI